MVSIFFASTAMIILVFLGCYFYDVYKKCRGESHILTAPDTTAPPLANNRPNNTNKNREPDLTLQYSTITLLDEPLIGTIRTIDEELGTVDVSTTLSKSVAVADFGNQVMIELDNKENETSCAICLNEYLPNDTVFRNDPSKCRHIFHTECILTWIQRNSPAPECPCCRSRIAVTKQYGTSDTIIKSTKHIEIELPTTTTSAISTTTTTRMNHSQPMEA